QDQTLHCSIVVLNLFPVLGLRYDSFAVPYRAGPRHQGAPRSTLASFAGLKLSKNCIPAFQSSLPFSHGRKRVQRYYIFHYTQHFLQLFFIKNFD
ncbi:MAG: hypothetical protein IKU00_09120, partial [Bacteroidales bacterium]|nr:hypothetical protein [Bacteroidales bacterium]